MFGATLSPGTLSQKKEENNMAIEKFRPEVIEQMANEKDQYINDDAKYLDSIIIAARKVLSGVGTRIRKGISGYYGDGNIGFVYGTMLDSIKTSHGEDRLYVLRDLTLREITNFGTAECQIHHISLIDAMKIYDVDRAAFAIKDTLKVTKRPRNRILPDGTIQIETITEQIHKISPAQIIEVLPLVGGETCEAIIDFAGSKKRIIINGSAARIKSLAEFDGYEP